MTESEKKRLFFQLERIRVRYDALFFKQLRRYYSEESITLIGRLKAGHRDTESFFNARVPKLLAVLTPLYESAIKEFYQFQNKLNKKDFTFDTKASFMETVKGIKDKISSRVQAIIDTTKARVTSIIETAQDVAEAINVWYNVPGRILRIAKTEVNTASNIGLQESADSSGNKFKQWISQRDSRVRESHVEMDGEEIPIDEIYSNGLEFPGDPSGDVSEVANCRCFQIFR